MKKQFIIYPYLLAIYPVIALFSRLPGGLQPITLAKPIFVQLLLAAIALGLFYLKPKDLQRASLLAALTVFYFSSTGYAYRSVQSSLWRDAPPSTHLGFVVLGVLIIIVEAQPIVWQKYLTKKRLATITNYLNIVSVLVLLYPLYQIGITLYRAADDANTPWRQLVNQGEVFQPLAKADERPDIYYIILDGYSRADVLQYVYGYDNGAFIQSLQERGFYVADQTGICAVDPFHAEIHPKKNMQEQEGNTLYKMAWIGIDEQIYILGWLHTLHPRPRTDDVLRDYTKGYIKTNTIVKRYGHLKEKLDRITRSPYPGLPFVISSDFEHNLIRKMKSQAKYWFIGFFAAVMVMFFIIQNWSSLV